MKSVSLVLQLGALTQGNYPALRTMQHKLAVSLLGQQWHPIRFQRRRKDQSPCGPTYSSPQVSELRIARTQRPRQKMDRQQM